MAICRTSPSECYGRSARALGRSIVPVDLYMQLRGVAYLRGQLWAESLVRVIPLDRTWPWPPTERMIAIAARKVDDLADHDPVVNARLIAEVFLGASDAWNRLLLLRCAS